jgi:hypothetical protein
MPGEGVLTSKRYQNLSDFLRMWKKIKVATITKKIFNMSMIHLAQS